MRNLLFRKKTAAECSICQELDIIPLTHLAHFALWPCVNNRELHLVCSNLGHYVTDLFQVFRIKVGKPNVSYGWVFKFGQFMKTCNGIQVAFITIVPPENSDKIIVVYA
jgi:hypothetical protein